MFDGLFEPTHLLMIAVALLVLVGPKRLPSVGRKIGNWLGEFRRATGGLTDELKTGMSEPLKADAAPAAAAPTAPAPALPAPGPVPADTPPAQTPAQ